MPRISQKISIRFKNFKPQCIAGKIYSRHLFRNRGLTIACLQSDFAVNDQTKIYSLTTAQELIFRPQNRSCEAASTDQRKYLYIAESLY